MSKMFDLSVMKMQQFSTKISLLASQCFGAKNTQFFSKYVRKRSFHFLRRISFK